MARTCASCRSLSCRDPWRRAVALPFWLAAVWLALGGGAVRAADATPGGSQDIAAGWQARVGVAPPKDAGLPAYGAAWSSHSSLSLFGDYYFGVSGLAGSAAPGASSGGFRATGGLFVGPRSGLGLSSSGMSAMGTAPREPRGFGLALPSAPRAPFDATDAASVPYVGVGYSGLKALRATGGGWAFSADVGVMALQPRSAGRFGQPSGADTLRDFQLSPLLQVGASYAF